MRLLLRSSRASSYWQNCVLVRPVQLPGETHRYGL